MDKTPRTTDAAPKQLKEPERRASSRKDSIEERILGILAWKKDMPQATLEKLNAGWFSSERREFAEHALAGKEAQSSHYIKKLALEAELAYEDDLQAHAEFEELTSGLKKEHIRAELETLASDMRRAEGQGDVGLLEKKMEEFKRLSQELHEE